MARFVDSFGDDDQADLSGLFCPNRRCGSSNIRILHWPRAGSWMHAVGRAECLDCRARFPIRELPAAQPTPPEEIDW